MTQQLRNWADLLARILLSHMFIIAGWGKIMGYAGTQGYMEAHGVPPQLLPLVILTELGGGILLILGWRTRTVAFLLGGFSALAALLFHTPFSAAGQMLQFMKDFTIAGGMLMVVVNGPGRFSVDCRRTAMRSPAEATQ